MTSRAGTTTRPAERVPSLGVGAGHAGGVRRSPALLTTSVLALTVTLTLGACSPPTADGAATSVTLTPAASATPDEPAGATGTAGTAEVTAGDLRLAVAGGTVAHDPRDDGSTILTVTPAPAAGGTTGTSGAADVEVTLLSPADARLAVLADGSVAVVRGDDAAPTTLGGLSAPTGGTFAARAADRVVLRVPADPATGASGTATTRLGADALVSAAWRDDDSEGGRSLAVDPTPWARVAGSAGADATWSQLVAEVPDADQPGMHDQLVCHALGAPDKATWNLEPWRPDVGLLAVLAARCNPR